MMIDEYMQNLLDSRSFRNDEYRKFVKNSYIIQGVYGNASPDKLCAFIRLARKNRKLQEMLTDLLHYIDKRSITHENFRLLNKFSKRTRDTYLSCIAHSELAFYQMMEINKVSGEFEAFAWLFDKICCNDTFNEEDMLRILEDNKAITEYGIQSCIDLIVKEYGNSRKLDVAREWLLKKE